MVDIKTLLIPIGIIGMVVFFIVATYFGLIDWSKIGIGESNISGENIYERSRNALSELRNRSSEELSKLLREGFKVNKTEEKPTILNLICNFIYENNITNTTLGNISCFKPKAFNVTIGYDCICYQ